MARFHRLPLIHPVTPPASELPEVRCRFSRRDSLLRVDFEVSRAGEPSLLPALQGPGPHWGLWDGDVVEVFVSVGGPEYYEFQVSPLDQGFELKVIRPRAEVDREFRSSYRHGASRSQGGWSAWIEVDLGRLGWSGDPAMIRGNAFAILGKPERRLYFSLFLPRQESPDYHLPRYFRGFPDLG